MTNENWARAGRVLTALATTLGVLIGLFAIRDRLIGPTLLGVVEFVQCAYDPATTEALVGSIDIKELSQLIAEREKAAQSPKKIVAAIQERLNSKPSGELRRMLVESKSMFVRHEMRLTLTNSGSTMASDVRLVLPGNGKFELSEAGVLSFSRDNKFVDWASAVPLGNIRPGATVNARVWSEAFPILVSGGAMKSVNPLLTHAQGTGRCVLVGPGEATRGGLDGDSRTGGSVNDPVSIQSRDYWFKVIEMLQQNWALIEPSAKGVTVYFVTDTSGVFDEMAFASKEDAETALRRNGFRRFSEDPSAASFLRCPDAPFHRSPHPNGSIHSEGRFWKSK